MLTNDLQNTHTHTHKHAQWFRRERNHLFASGISFFALLGITVSFFVESLGLAMQPSHDDKDDVNPYIVSPSLAFRFPSDLARFLTDFLFCFLLALVAGLWVCGCWNCF
jgi:hypothetical protein